jgi:hypothetical protein
MEVIINDKTFTLLPLNRERRDLFCQIVCNPPKLDEKNQRRYLYALQQYEEIKSQNWFKKIFKPKKFQKEKKWLASYIKRKEEEIAKPMKEYAQGILKTLWAFLKADDKKEIGTIAKLNIKNEDLEKWQKEVVVEIEKTIKYFADKKENIAITNEKDTVEAFLILSGHNREDVRNMSPIDLYEAIEGAKLDKERARVVALNDRALANTYAKGSRDSLNAIKRITNDFKRKSIKPIKMTPEQEKELSVMAWDLYLEKLTKGNG